MLLLTTTCLLLLAAASNCLPQSNFAPPVTNSTKPEKETAVTSVHFSTNTTKVVDGKPFLASCTIANLTHHASLNYTVRYYRSDRLDSRQFVAAYKIKVKHSGHQSAIFNSEIPSYYFSASPGAHFAYPTFDLIVMNNYAADLRKNYWCEVEVEDSAYVFNTTSNHTTTTVSNVWVNAPIVRLSIGGPLASDPANTTFTASCQVHFLERRILKGPEYQVKLLLANSADLIPNRYHELAVFKVPLLENAPTVFLRNDTYLGRTAQFQGDDNDDLPLFDFVYRAWGAGGKKDYFACRLEDPASDWKQVTSDKVLHL